jgi:hypothetical protein
LLLLWWVAHSFQRLDLDFIQGMCGSLSCLFLASGSEVTLPCPRAAHFKPERFWWELALTLRRLVIAVTVVCRKPSVLLQREAETHAHVVSFFQVVGADSPFYRAWVLVFVVFLSLSAHSHYQPYRVRRVARLRRLHLPTLSLSLAAFALCLETQEPRLNQLESLSLHALLFSFSLELLAHSQPDSGALRVLP